jgi:AcrR family transcriptional regulator
MAYEVIKRVGQRAYRYSVESYRDPGSKKVRAHWTYLGPVRSAEAEPPRIARRAKGSTRERLLDAFERLVQNHPYVTVTAGAVAIEAGVAHGTFYRYFKDKPALLRGALARIRDDIDRVQPSFDPPFGSVADERTRIRGWVSALLERPAERQGVKRAYYEALDDDPDLQALRVKRRRERIAALRGYLEALVRAGTIALAEPASLASALIMLLEGAFRASVLKTNAPDDVTIAGVVSVVERAIFA